MENLYLLYDGKKIIYTKSKDHDRTISLPLTRDEFGRYNRNFIQHDFTGWKMSSTVISDKSTFSNVWISDSGDIYYNDSENTHTRRLKEKIDSDKKSDNPIYCRAQELYDILDKNAETIVAYEEAPWKTEQVIDLRRRRLATYLKMLGYSSISDIRKKEEPSGEYASLSRVGESLENYRTLTLVRNEINLLGNENYAIGFPERETTKQTIEEFSKLIEGVEAEIGEDISFIQEKDETLDRSRAISGDYFLNMKRKVSPDEWQKYYSTVIKVAKLVMGLNYDLLSREDREGIEDLTSLTQEQVEDRISQLIDARDFDKASDIENRYATKETENFATIVDELTGSSDRFTRGQLAEALSELKEEALATRAEKAEKIEAFNKMEKFYKNATKIILSNPKNKEE